MDIKNLIKKKKKWLVIWWIATLVINGIAFAISIVPALSVIACIVVTAAYIAGIILPVYIGYLLAKDGKDLVEALVPVTVGWVGNTIIVIASGLVTTVISGSIAAINSDAMYSVFGGGIGLLMTIVMAIPALVLNLILGAIGYFIFQMTKKGK